MQPRIGACLHVSPETIVMRFLEKHAASYLSIDLDPVHVMQREDLTGLSFADASFDFIFCAHVLEHIPDDHRAMRELHRVLKPGGMAILQVPLTQHAFTYEDPSITDPAARRKAFAQEDHVRKYGQDYRSRLAEAGFTVRVERYFHSLPRIVRKAFGLRSEDLYLCTK
jgi:SAM-dependent methyltransferase